ncbi:hypothetical protein ACVGVM_19805 [Pseudonocardia bannensis]|uniref:hypothetical protein n=1 Tax=Pseudonocardia bannensis TaxID=630973 RepID=UPI0028A60230|nr:hypothetical protein [Pseudonocardia bannensis]
MSWLTSALARLTGRDELPAGFEARLEADERVLAVAEVAGGGHLVVTSWGVWLPGAQPRRVGWHLISKATWKDGAIVLVEAEESGDAGGAMLLTDRPARRLRLADPGRVPQVVHERVTGSIRSRHHRDLPGGGAWFLQRKVPGRDGIVLQVRADPGTDEAVVRQVAADVARKLPR